MPAPAPAPAPAPIPIHAWFSAQTALRNGSAVYRKPGGSTVNVTRMDDDRDSRETLYHDEIYLGQVTRQSDGGCVRDTWRVAGITG
jgi:hypothetical protein